MSLTSYRAAPPRGGGWVGEGPGGDLLFRALRRSTIGAEGFHGRVRDGIGCFAPRYGHQAVEVLASPAIRGQSPWERRGERVPRRKAGAHAGPRLPGVRIAS